MKNVRIVISIILMIAIIASLTTVKAVDYSGTATLTTSNYLKAGEEVKVSVKLSALTAGDGVDAILATLVYDDNVFEKVETKNLEGTNKWEINRYNPDTKKFTMTRPEKMSTPGDVVVITLKIKQAISVDSTTIELKDITISGGDALSGGTGDIDVTKGTVTIGKEPTKPQPETPKDTTKPVITLNGTDVTIKVNETYKDAGATAKDDVDGDLTSKIKVEIKKDGKVVDKVDTSKVGTYVITYTVTDAAGNVGTKTRTVKVIENTNTNTMSGGKLPQTGENYIVIGATAILIAAGAIFYLKYNKVNKF